MAAIAPKTADNYRKQIDYWKKQAWKARQDATFSRSERDDAREKYMLAEALVKKQDADIAEKDKQIARLVDESRKHRYRSIVSIEHENATLRTQLHDMFRKRNELRTKCEAHEADVSRWDGLMKTAAAKIDEVTILLEDMSAWFVGSFVIAVASIITNVAQWYFHR